MRAFSRFVLCLTGLEKLALVAMPLRQVAISDSLIMEKFDLPKRRLGNTHMLVTRLGYGSMGLRGPNTWGVRVVDDRQAEDFLHLVLDAGINFIDTSPDYGVAEQRIGRALAERRSEFYLATKCGCVYTQHEDHLEIDHRWARDVIASNLETSLNRMRTDYVDLLQFHGGDAATLEANGLIEQLLDFKSQGVVRSIGVSSKVPHLPALIRLGVFDTIQLPYSCLAPEHEEWLTAAADAGAGVIVRGGIAHGGPDAEIQRPALNEVWTKAELDNLLPAGMERAEFILRFTLSQPCCHTTIVGTSNHEHLLDNLQAAKAGPLPAELVQVAKQRVASVLTNGAEQST
jgi:aryl-alcohol dehydrogenase-like predicted oxidoreductase